jgi:multicomponent Na+:H+ antiporter subunit E
MFAINLMLMLAWCGSFGSFAPWTLFTGFIVGFVALYLTRRLWGEPEPQYFHKTIAFLRFFAFYANALFQASLQIAHQVLSPRLTARPGVIAVPLEAERDIEIAALAILITLTPGTISLDVSEDRSTLYVHAMFLHDPEAVLHDIKENFERGLLEFLR